MRKTLLPLSLSLLVVTLPLSSLRAKESVEPAPLRYTLEEMKGEVTLIPAGGTQARAVTLGDAVGPGDEVHVGPEGEAVLFLNEETVIHLGGDSVLAVDRLEPTEQGGFLNRLRLMAGRVLSEVKNLAKARSTFEVESGGVVCGVRGTSFEVERSGDQVDTTTYEGEVEVKSGDSLERVKAGYRFGFLKNRVLMKRKLDRIEKDRFEKWTKHRKTLKDKYLKRMKVLRNQHQRNLQKSRLRYQDLKQKRKDR